MLSLDDYSLTITFYRLRTFTLMKHLDLFSFNSQSWFLLQKINVVGENIFHILQCICFDMCLVLLSPPPSARIQACIVLHSPLDFSTP